MKSLEKLIAKQKGKRRWADIPLLSPEQEAAGRLFLVPRSVASSPEAMQQLFIQDANAPNSFKFMDICTKLPSLKVRVLLFVCFVFFPVFFPLRRSRFLSPKAHVDSYKRVQKYV